VLATSLNKVSYGRRVRSLSPQLDDSTVMKLGSFVWIALKLEPDDDETCFTTTGSVVIKVSILEFKWAPGTYEQSTDDWRRKQNDSLHI
jgi:hypothetical protein